MKLTSGIIVCLTCLLAGCSQAQLVSYYSFDETGGTVISDSMGTNHGTVLGGAAFASGAIENALQFDGVDDCVMIPATHGFNFGQSFSISAWIYMSSPKDMDVFTCNYNGGTTGYNVVLRVYGYGRIRFCFYGQNLETEAGVVPIGTWTHIAVTHDATTRKSSIYLNGELVLEGNVGRYIGGAAPVYIGKWNVYYQNQNFFLGMIDELGVYNHAMTAEEVEQCYNQALDPYFLTLSKIRDSISRKQNALAEINKAIEGDKEALAGLTEILDSGDYRGMKRHQIIVAKRNILISIIRQNQSKAKLEDSIKLMQNTLEELSN